MPLGFTTRVRIAEKIISQVIPPNAVGPRPDYLAKVRLADTPDGNTEPAVPQSFVRRYVIFIGFARFHGLICTRSGTFLHPL